MNITKKINVAIVCSLLAANAFGGTLIIKKSASAGGGGLADDTLLVGHDSIGGTTDTLPGTPPELINTLMYTAEETGTPRECFVYGKAIDGTDDSYTALYGSDEALLCQSSAFNMTESLAWQGPFMMSSCSEISSATDYYIGVGGEGYMSLYFDSGDWDAYYNGGTSTEAPATITESAADGGDVSYGHPMSIYCTNGTEP